MAKKKQKINYLKYCAPIAFLIVGFTTGYMYKKAPINENHASPSNSLETTSAKERRALIKKCGDIPTDKISIINDIPGRVENAVWSPNCEKIAYNILFGPIIGHGSPSEFDIQRSGIYVYTTKGVIERVYVPEGKSNERFLKWKDNNTIFFSHLEQPKTSMSTHSIDTDGNAVSGMDFDVERVSIGDKIGEMRIATLRGYKASRPTRNNAFVSFKGITKVKGKVAYDPPGSYGGEKVCISNLDEDSFSKLPKLFGRTYKNYYFCLSNLEDAKNVLVGTSGNGTGKLVNIAIDNYTISYAPVETWDTAVFITLLE